jgi:hypothetical protein
LTTADSTALGHRVTPILSSMPNALTASLIAAIYYRLQTYRYRRAGK